MNCKQILLSFALVLFPVFLHATEDPAVQLEKTIDAALDIFYEADAAEKSGEEKRIRIAALLAESYDLSIIMRRAMGRNWKKLSTEEQEEVLSLFDQLVIKVTYDRLSSGIEKPKIRYGKTVYESDKRVRISSVIKVEGTSYNVDYRLGKLASGWQIYDIVAEDISFVSNYRQQFNDHFRRSDGASLIRKLKEKLTNEDSTAQLSL
ncbi:MAG: MlaC/ttg2D family ABC transporter substrate-binding protein [Coraliomargaritaceae bacterium]